MLSQPRLVIGATRSGDGKTTVATGLMAALRARGLRVSAHKAGPDYIDPSYHAAATGSPGRNLDVWLTGEELIAPLFRHGAGNADVSIIEGVMGLFDGVAGQGDLASTAHVARLLDAPVVLVVSAAGAARSIAATVHGFATFDRLVRVRGVLLNQVSSARHEAIAREAIAATGIPVLGALPAEATLRTPSRHLGLVPAAERAAQVSDWLPRLRELIAAHVDLDAMLAIARSAPPLAAEPWSPAPAPGTLEPEPAAGPWSPAAPRLAAAAGKGRPGARDPAGAAGPPPRRSLESRRGGAPVRVAVAAGRAFTFGYAEHQELLEAAGAEVITFDPMTTERLPEGTDALVVGGGFPEVYVEDLTANTDLRADIRARVAGGMPVVAECAGLLWLGTDLDGREQCGVLPASARMTGRLTLGYREAVALRSSPLVPAGTTVRAHEFHRTISEPAGGDRPAWRLADGSEQGWADDQLLASYLHLHWAGLPGGAARLVSAAAAARTSAGSASAGRASAGNAGVGSVHAGRAGTGRAGQAGGKARV
ncbi:MAG TPA: cobyrinate a,c-diamide synthase [Streptosporangiaceae bacterium]|nr:cobyrinate a,c-diamide synthase [Streptosporangiaceae bacterium]